MCEMILTRRSASIRFGQKRGSLLTTRRENSAGCLSLAHKRSPGERGDTGASGSVWGEPGDGEGNPSQKMGTSVTSVGSLRAGGFHHGGLPCQNHSKSKLSNWLAPSLLMSSIGAVVTLPRTEMASPISRSAVKRCALGAVIAAAYQLTHDFDTAHELGYKAIAPI